MLTMLNLLLEVMTSSFGMKIIIIPIFSPELLDLDFKGIKQQCNAINRKTPVKLPIFQKHCKVLSSKPGI